MLLDFEWFKQPVSPYYLHENLIVTIKLNKPKKLMLCPNNAATTYKISDVALEYDSIIDAAYMKKVSKNYGNLSYPSTRVTRLSYQILRKKGKACYYFQ